MKKTLISILLLSLAMCSKSYAVQNRVITVIPAINSLAGELLDGTEIIYSLAVPDGTTIHRLEVDNGLAKDVSNAAISADAIIYMGSSWEKDFSYRWARSGNIGIIPIDCIKPMDGANHPSVAIGEGREAPMPWLTYPGCLSMLEVMARDLKKIYPEKKGIIEKNLSKIRKRLKREDLRWQDLFLSLEELDIASYRLPRTDLVQTLGLIETETFKGDPYYWSEKEVKRFQDLPEGQVMLTTRNLGTRLEKISQKKKLRIALIDDYQNGDRSLFEVIGSNLDILYSKLIKEVSR